MQVDLLTRRQRHFVLWRLAVADPPPVLVVGRLQVGAPVTLVDMRRIKLARDNQFPDLWSVSAQDCDLADGVYHYWFEVTDARPNRAGQRIQVTDPLATTVDWRLRAGLPSGPNNSDDDRYPASVICCRGGTLLPCDAGGETLDGGPDDPRRLPPNNRIVIYELPTAWSALTRDGSYERDVGTFRDVQALVERDDVGANFAGLAVTAAGRSYLADELGVNAVELLPPADSAYVRTWDYGTTNFLAPDFELGFPADSSYPTPNRDLRALVDALHGHGMRFFVDSVTAFAKLSPYLAVAPDDFFIFDPAHADAADPDRCSSRGQLRCGYGSDLFRYESFYEGYDPLSGTNQPRVSPGSALLRVALARWMTDFRVDGIRMDSIENVFSWDFVGAYRQLARELWRARYGVASDSEVDARFLVVGEELWEPPALLTQHRLDALWHDAFKRYVRAVIMGRGADGRTFEDTVRLMIDCRASRRYTGLTQAVIYLTSHDVEGGGNQRLYNFLRTNGVIDCEKRIKLAFACLLTAVGIPQILAGDEFADQHDLLDQDGNVTEGSGKQIDPVNYSRLGDDWRIRIKDYVGRLIHLRTSCDALATNDVEVIHVDLDGKQVVAWRRGIPGSDSVVVVVANFSDFATPAGPAAEYVVPNWPAIAQGGAWREVGQDRNIPPEWIGREPLFPWEAKVYASYHP